MTDRARQIGPGPDWIWLLGLGAVLILGGLLALLNPFAASLTVNVIAGATFVAGGLVQVVLGLRGGDGSDSRLVPVLFGIILVLFGVSLWSNPVAGILSLTILAGIFFLAIGAIRLWIALRIRARRKAWTWMAASGALSAVLGFVTLVAVPVGAVGLLGVFLGAELLMSGAAAIALSLGVRNAS